MRRGSRAQVPTKPTHRNGNTRPSTRSLNTRRISKLAAGVSAAPPLAPADAPCDDDDDDDDDAATPSPRDLLLLFLFAARRLLPKNTLLLLPPPLLLRPMPMPKPPVGSLRAASTKITSCSVKLRHRG